MTREFKAVSILVLIPCLLPIVFWVANLVSGEHISWSMERIISFAALWLTIYSLTALVQSTRGARGFHFSLRSLLIAMTVVAVVLGMAAWSAQ